MADVSVRLGLGWEAVLDLSMDRIDALLAATARAQARRDADALLFLHLSTDAAAGSKPARSNMTSVFDKLKELANE